MSPRGVCAPGAALAGLLVWAASAAEAPAAMRIDFSVGTRVMTTDNLHLDAEPATAGQREPVQENVFALAPRLLLDWREGQDRFFADSRGEYWVFDGDEELDPVWLPSLAAELGWRRWAPFFLEAAAQRDFVSDTQDQSGQSVIDQSVRNLFTLRTGFTRDFGTTTAELAYRGELETFTGGGEDGDDRVVSHFGQGLLRHRWTPLWNGEISGDYGRVEQDLAPDYTQLNVEGFVDHRFSERLSARVRLEWLREEEDAAAGAGAATAGATRTTFLKGAEITGALQRGGSWALSYEDRLAAQPDGDRLQIGRASLRVSAHARLGSTFGAEFWHETRDYRDADREETVWGPSLDLRWMIAPWCALDAEGDWSDSLIRAEGEDDVEDRTTRANGVLIAVLARHLVAEGGYLHRANSSTDATREYTANLFYAGDGAPVVARQVEQFGREPVGGLLKAVGACERMLRHAAAPGEAHLPREADRLSAAGVPPLPGARTSGPAVGGTGCREIGGRGRWQALSWIC